MIKYKWLMKQWLIWISIHTLRVHYAHAAANLDWLYSKYAKVARVHYFCTIGDVANSKRPLLIIPKVQLRLRVTRRSATALARYPQKLAKIVCG